MHQHASEASFRDVHLNVDVPAIDHIYRFLRINFSIQHAHPVVMQRHM